LTEEGQTAISTAARATPGAVYCIIRHHETFGACEAFSQGGPGYPSKLSDDVLESIELFKLAKLRIYGWEIHERLLSDRICNRPEETKHRSPKGNVKVCMELKFD